MLMDTGGNAGGQASVSIIRALSLNDIEFQDIFKVIFKEFRISILCAIVLAICNSIKMLIIDHVSIMVASTVCITLGITVILAKFIGSTLPMIAKKIGLDPAVMGLGPITSSKKALEKAGWQVKDLERVEANEAFATQSLAVIKDLGLDSSIVNVNGGAVALGHPIGCSGARILVTLLYELKHSDLHKGLATLCVGGGMGVAMCVERI